MRDGYGHKNFYCYVTCYFKTGGSQTISWGGHASPDAEAKSQIKYCREYVLKIINNYI